jgi:hypothetical protein
MDLEDVERTLCDRLDAISALAQLLIDLEESPHSRAVVLGELRVRETRGQD